jgi:hypothetical protein
MIVYFNTVKRKRPVKEGGEMVKLSWRLKKVLKQIPIFPTQPDILNDPNPRGNSRGGKGIIITDKELFVGTYHTILVFDFDLNLKRTITNNLFVNIHEMCWDQKNIWVSSTTIDCAILINQMGETLKTFWPREEPLLQEQLGLFPMQIDKNSDNRLKHIHSQLGQKAGHTHLNSVTKHGRSTYVLLNRLGTVVKIEPEVNLVINTPLVIGAHSLVISSNGARMILCSSFKHSILFFNLKTGRLEKSIDLLDFKEVAELHERFPDQPFNKSIFVRGLEVIDSRRILIGVSPATILEIDIEKDKLLDLYQFSNDVGDAIHGLIHVKEC